MAWITVQCGIQKNCQVLNVLLTRLNELKLQSAIYNHICMYTKSVIMKSLIRGAAQTSIGIIWRPVKDTFFFNINSNSFDVLSEISFNQRTTELWMCPVTHAEVSCISLVCDGSPLYAVSTPNKTSSYDLETVCIAFHMRFDTVYPSS